MATTKTARAKPKTAAKKPAAKKSTKKKAAAKARAKTTGARAVPRGPAKVSPLRGMKPDDWAKRLKGWHGDALRLIRALVARHAPNATLSIKWGQPVWEHNGPFAWAKSASGHFSVGFWRGADLSDPDGHLEGSGGRMRHVKLKSASDLERVPLAAFLREAVALNDAKGDPTKRGRRG